MRDAFQGIARPPVFRSRKAAGRTNASAGMRRTGRELNRLSKPCELRWEAAQVRQLQGFAIMLGTAMLGGCALLPAGKDGGSHTSVTPFSQASAGAALPGGWQPWVLAKFKRPTVYDMVRDAGGTVVQARAEASASGLVHALAELDPRRYRDLGWQWKIEQLIKAQDNTRRATEDAPARVIVKFGGDRAKLDFGERAFAAKVKAMTGYDMPHATLMYIWARDSALETVIPNHHTDRVKMIVAETGSAPHGARRAQKPGMYADFRRAFGEEPGPIIGVGIMTDTDNTGEQARAWYGDITLRAARD